MMKQQEIKHISHFGYFSLHQLMILSIHHASKHEHKQGGKRHLLKKMSANTNLNAYCNHMIYLTLLCLHEDVK